MKSKILVVLYALSFALSSPLPSLQVRHLNQVVGPCDGSTLAQLCQDSAASDSNKARASSLDKQRRDNSGEVDGVVDDSLFNDPQYGGNDQLVGDQSDDSSLIASGLSPKPIDGLSIKQTQYINTMLNKFGPDGPATPTEARMVVEFAKGAAGRNALTPDEVKAALNWIFEANWKYNPFINLIRALTATWKDQ